MRSALMAPAANFAERLDLILTRVENALPRGSAYFQPKIHGPFLGPGEPGSQF